MELVRTGEAFAVVSNDTDFAIALGSRLVLLKHLFAREYPPPQSPHLPRALQKLSGKAKEYRPGKPLQGKGGSGGGVRRGPGGAYFSANGGSGAPQPLSPAEEAELRRATARDTFVADVQSPEWLAARLGLPRERLVDLGILLVRVPPFFVVSRGHHSAAEEIERGDVCFMFDRRATT